MGQILNSLLQQAGQSIVNWAQSPQGQKTLKSLATTVCLEIFKKVCDD